MYFKLFTPTAALYHVCSLARHRFPYTTKSNIDPKNKIENGNSNSTRSDSPCSSRRRWRSRRNRALPVRKPLRRRPWCASVFWPKSHGWCPLCFRFRDHRGAALRGLQRHWYASLTHIFSCLLSIYVISRDSRNLFTLAVVQALSPAFVSAVTPPLVARSAMRTSTTTALRMVSRVFSSISLIVCDLVQLTRPWLRSTSRPFKAAPAASFGLTAIPGSIGPV